MPGLRRVDDHTFVVTMQQINAAILNPAFLLLLLGSPALVGASALVAADRRWWLVAFGLAVAAHAVTVVVNLPLNAALDLTHATSVPASARARAAFERSWSRAHRARTLLLGCAFATCVVALGA